MVKIIQRLLLFISLSLCTFNVFADIESAFKAYDNGDYQSSFSQFLELAKQGNPAAQHMVGMHYHTRKGVDKTPKEIVYWFTKAAENGVIPSQALLAGMYITGTYVEQSYEKGLFWSQEAAKRGRYESQLVVANLLSNGEIFKPNLIEAYAWFTVAKQQNNGIQADIDNLESKMNDSEINKAKELSLEYIRLYSEK